MAKGPMEISALLNPYMPPTPPLSSPSTSVIPSLTSLSPQTLVDLQECLKMAKKKHYQPVRSASAIQKTTGSKKPQGRPFTDDLNARFYLHARFEDILCNLTKQESFQLGSIVVDYLSNQWPFISLASSLEYHRSDSGPKFRRLLFTNRNLPRKGVSSDSKRLTIDVHSALCAQFGVSKLTFVKVVRNSYSKILKLETFAPLERDINVYMNENLDVNDESDKSICSPQWVKKNVAYPRYKSSMKIHVLEGEHSFILYNDVKMLEWDIVNNNHFRNLHKKVLINVKEFQ